MTEPAAKPQHPQLPTPNSQLHSVRVLHVGDVHLGVELYGRPDPEKGYGTRVGDFLRALDSALEHAAEADLVLFPGDIYKNCDPSPTVQREFASRIRQVARQVPVVIIPGNHDVPNMAGRATSVDIFRVLELDNVHVFRQPTVQTVRTRVGDVLIAPLPFFPRSRLVATEEARGKGIPEVLEMMRQRLIGYVADLAAGVTERRAELGESTPAILMAHYTIQGAIFGGYGKGALLAPEVELPLSAVRNDVFDYVALAHIHKHQPIPIQDRHSQPPVVYAGSIERVDFSEEDEEKVAVLAEVRRGHTEWRSVHLKPRPFVTIRVTADEADPLESVRAAVESKREQIPGAVIRLLYTLPQGLPNLPERELRQMLEGAHYVAAIRREMPPREARGRVGALTTQLTPIEALEEYLRTQPKLEPQREDLLQRAGALVAELDNESETA
jgi:DNA repair protein SbcD/Mre11